MKTLKGTKGCKKNGTGFWKSGGHNKKVRTKVEQKGRESCRRSGGTGAETHRHFMWVTEGEEAGGGGKGKVEFSRCGLFKVFRGGRVFRGVSLLMSKKFWGVKGARWLDGRSYPDPQGSTGQYQE